MGFQGDGHGTVIPHQHPYGIGKYGNSQGIWVAAIIPRLINAVTKVTLILLFVYISTQLLNLEVF